MTITDAIVLVSAGYYFGYQIGTLLIERGMKWGTSK